MYDHSKLPVRVYCFDPRVDLHQVDPSGEVNLRKAYANGAIEGNVAFEDGSFNGVQDPSVLLPRPKDQFERMRQFEFVRESLRANQSKTDSVTSNGESK